MLLRYLKLVHDTILYVGCVIDACHFSVMRQYWKDIIAFFSYNVEYGSSLGGKCNNGEKG